MKFDEHLRIPSMEPFTAELLDGSRIRVMPDQWPPETLAWFFGVPVAVVERYCHEIDGTNLMHSDFADFRAFLDELQEEFGPVQSWRNDRDFWLRWTVPQVVKMYAVPTVLVEDFFGDRREICPTNLREFCETVFLDFHTAEFAWQTGQNRKLYTISGAAEALAKLKEF